MPDAIEQHADDEPGATGNEEPARELAGRHFGAFQPQSDCPLLMTVKVQRAIGALSWSACPSGGAPIVQGMAGVTELSTGGRNGHPLSVASNPAAAIIFAIGRAPN